MTTQVEERITRLRESCATLPHDRRALLEYVGRLEGAMRQIRGTCARTLAEPETDTETLVIVCTSVEKALATSPLTGQPLQKVQQFGWRPIAEAPEDRWLFVGKRALKEWYSAALRKPWAIANGYTHYLPEPAPPAREVENG